MVFILVKQLVSKPFVNTSCRYMPKIYNSKFKPPVKELLKKSALVEITKPRIVTIWKDLFEKHLLMTNTVSAGVLMVAGDILSQELDYQRGLITTRYDWCRSGRMFLVGTIQGPLHHFFYGWMTRIMPIATMRNTFKKIVLDQLIMSPLCILLFFYPASILENKTLAEATSEIRNKFTTVYITDWCVWPAAQFINFQYLSSKYNVIFVNVMTMLYNIFLSYMKHKDQTEDQTK